ncbi:MAG: AAA family ATPase [Melioribacteraceae bacterium]|nr:AAA family ATPase [Melioribacteraceae bacterium]
MLSFGNWATDIFHHYAIDKGLVGDYSHLSLVKTTMKKHLRSIITDSSWAIGYEDVMMTIEEQIDPILNPSEAMEWGLQNPGGIILFGPPGCGKTFWAQWISRHLDYELEEVPRSMFGSSYVDGAMKRLKEKLDEVKKKPKTLLFFDEFDSVARSRQSGSGNANEENSKVVNTLLQENSEVN